MNIFKRKIKREEGFSLLEATVAGAVLLVGVLSIVALLSDSLQQISTTRNRVIAASLAQEGVEVVHGIRDGNWIQGEDYDNGIPEGTFCVDYNSTTTTACSDENLYRNGSVYSHDSTSGESTIFSRHMEVSSSGTTSMNVKAVVEWSDRGATRSITVEEDLYNWK